MMKYTCLMYIIKIPQGALNSVNCHYADFPLCWVLHCSLSCSYSISDHVPFQVYYPRERTRSVFGLKRECLLNSIYPFQWIWWKHSLILRHHSTLFVYWFLFCTVKGSLLSILCSGTNGWLKPGRHTYPSLCNWICRTAFVHRSRARTEAHLACARCVHSQGQRRHHKCSGRW